jgi:guanine deaminase
MHDHDKFMKQAIALSIDYIDTGTAGPFGCVVVKDGLIVGRGWNQVLGNNDPTAHAEVMAIRDACKNLNTYQLNGCDIYTSCEPCPMCLGAIYWARPDKVYFANTKADAAAAGFDDSFIYEQLNLPFAQRSISLISMPNTDAIKAFELWNSKERQRY